MKKYTTPHSTTLSIIPEGMLATSGDDTKMKVNDEVGTGAGWFSEKKIWKQKSPNNQ